MIDANPIPAAPPASLPWYEVWMDAWSSPRVETFRRILADPRAGSGRAFTWVAVVGLISGLASGALGLVNGSANLAGGQGAVLLTTLLCTVIAAPLGAVIGLAIQAGILRGIASLLGGQGTFDRLSYSLAAIACPVTALTAVLSAAVPPADAAALETFQLPNQALLGIIIAGAISLLLSLYALYLNIVAVKTVEGFGWGRAVATVLIPGAVLLLLAACVFGVFILAITQSKIGV